MPDKNISYAQIAIAAEALRTKGKKLTLSNIANLLKSDETQRATVEKHFKQWLETHDQTSKSAMISSQDGMQQNIDEDAYKALQKRTNELSQSLALVRATLDSTEDGILIIDCQGKLVDWNEKFLQMANLPEEIMEKRDESVIFTHLLEQLVNPEVILEQVTKMYENPEAEVDLKEVYYKDGRILERYSQPHLVDGKIHGRVWSFRDVTKRRKAEEDMRLYQRAIESSTHGVLIMDAQQKTFPIMYSNPAFLSITGYTDEEITGKSMQFLLGHEQEQAAFLKLKLAMQEGRDADAELRGYKKDGQLFWTMVTVSAVPNVNHEKAHYVALIHDITERKNMEEQLLHQATHDSLTSLPNRSLLDDRVRRAIKSAVRNNTKLAMLFLDLDDFKLINDRLGHDCGDKLLQEVSERLEAEIREVDTVARIGGDEFIIIFSDLQSEEDIMMPAHKLLMEIRKPYCIDGHKIEISASIGISFYPKDGQNALDLMRCADISMYHAKENGRNNFKFYTDELNERIEKRFTMEENLKKAIKEQQFVLFYQPLYQADNKKIIGAEALIRWPHPTLGNIPPDHFIPIAEDTGLIVTLSAWILEAACMQLKNWKDAGFDQLSLAVNLSAREFKQKDLAKNIKRLLKKLKISPERLELELTERMLIKDDDDTLRIMHEIKDLGVKLSIDDFGVGFSSLSYLKIFPVDKLKIDRSFIKDINEETLGTKDTALLHSIVDLSHGLGLKVVAEGVETEIQSQFLTEAGCDYLQGYYHSKPVDVDTYNKLLEKESN